MIDSNPMNKAITSLAHFLAWLACFAGLLMMLHVTADVIGRVAFGRPLYGTIEIVSGYYMVAVSFLPLAYIAKYEGHIFVELFTRKLPDRAVIRVDLVVDIVTFAYMCLFTWLTTAMAIEQTIVGELWESATGFVPIWPSRWMLPVGCFAMTAYLAVRVARGLRGAPGDGA